MRLTYCIGGYKLDQNNGGVPNWNITVRNATTGALLGWNVTNSNGYWQVCGLPQGIYNVSETPQAGWVAVTPASGYQPVTLSTEDNKTVNFTNIRSLCLSGYKLDGNNGPLSGWTITEPMQRWVYRRATLLTKTDSGKSVDCLRVSTT